MCELTNRWEGAGGQERREFEKGQKRAEWREGSSEGGGGRRKEIDPYSLLGYSLFISVITNRRKWV